MCMINNTITLTLSLLPLNSINLICALLELYNITILRRRPDCCHWLRCSMALLINKRIADGNFNVLRVPKPFARQHSRSFDWNCESNSAVRSFRRICYVRTWRPDRLSYFVYMHLISFDVSLYHIIYETKDTTRIWASLFFASFCACRVPCCNMWYSAVWYGHSITTG